MGHGGSCVTFPTLDFRFFKESNNDKKATHNHKKN